MAYTFEEAVDWWRNQPPPIPGLSTLVANVTLLRTQEDGRTGYLLGLLGNLSEDPQNGISFSGGGMEQFSDRVRDGILWPEGTGRPYSQNFDNRSANDAEQTDRSDVTFTRLPNGGFRLHFFYPRWNVTSEVYVSQIGGTKLYAGYGTPIGDQPFPLAAHVLSIQSMQVIPL